MFLEIFAGIVLMIMCSCGGVHCGKWCHHFHGAHKAHRDNEDCEKWAAIEDHFLSKFEEMAGNGSPAVEMSVETDMDIQAGKEEDSTIAVREVASSLAPRPTASVCDQTTQVYTCSRGVKQSCLATAVKEISEEV